MAHKNVSCLSLYWAGKWRQSTCFALLSLSLTSLFPCPTFFFALLLFNPQQACRVEQLHFQCWPTKTIARAAFFYRSPFANASNGYLRNLPARALAYQVPPPPQTIPPMHQRVPRGAQIICRRPRRRPSPFEYLRNILSRSLL
jgi:hypothetical protein